MFESKVQEKAIQYHWLGKGKINKDNNFWLVSDGTEVYNGGKSKIPDLMTKADNECESSLCDWVSVAIVCRKKNKH